MIFNTCGGPPAALPAFTGSHALFGNGRKGYIELYSTGTLTLTGKKTVDIFAVGGGKRGGNGSYSSSSAGTSGEGGKAGANFTLLRQTLGAGDYAVTVGAADGNSAFGELGVTASQGIGAPGASRSSSGNGYPGSAGVRPFGDGSFNLVEGAGGSGAMQIGGGTSFRSGGAGGEGGGGAGGNFNGRDVQPQYQPTSGSPGVASTGGGGGGAGRCTNEPSYPGVAGGVGGSGLVIVRWGY